MARRLSVLAMLAAVALAGCTNAPEERDLDLDDDIAEDADELAGVNITIRTPSGEERRHVTSDPTLRDTDGDGLLDGDELFVRGTDPRDVDTDDDGLLDGKDVPVAQAPAEEWRRLGILERESVFLGELDACPGGSQALKGNAYTSDVPFPDELGDGEEIRGWDILVRGAPRHVTSDPCRTDTDSDGLQDHEEKRVGTDPRVADTDGDGAVDGVDADPLFDLGLAFDDLRTNATGATLSFAAGDQSATLGPGNATASLQVADATGDPAHLKLNVLVTASGPDGAALRLFPDGRAGAIVGFDLLAKDVTNARVEGDRLHFEGPEGEVSFRWSVTRR